MKITCKREALAAALKTVAAVAPARSAKPILQNVLIDPAASDELALYATDLDAGVRRTVASVEITGDRRPVCLPAAQLARIVGDCWGERVTLEVDAEDRARIHAENADFTLCGLPAGEFPPPPQIPDTRLEISAALFSAALSRALPCTAREEDRYSLAGVFVAAGKNTVEVAATDTFRLALSRIVVEGAEGRAFKALLHARGAQAIQTALAGQERATLAAGDSCLYARCGQTEIFSALLEAKFPDYNGVIPEMDSLPLAVSVEAESLKRALKAVSHTIDAERLIVTVIPQAGGSLRLLTENCGSSGDATVEAAVEMPPDLNLSINLNLRYLQAAISAIDEDNLVLRLRDADSPVRIDSVERGGFTLVISPICKRE